MVPTRQERGQPLRNAVILCAVATAIVVRVAVFLFASAHPLKNESGALVSPMLMQQGVDISFYLDYESRYERFREEIQGFFQNVLSPGSGARVFISGPVLPLLLEVFGYHEGHTLPLAAFFLSVSCLLVFGWTVWLYQQGVGAPWLFLFALIPNPIWYTINISTDLLFSGIFGAFFLSTSNPLCQLDAGFSLWGSLC